MFSAYWGNLGFAPMGFHISLQSPKGLNTNITKSNH